MISCVITLTGLVSVCRHFKMKLKVLVLFLVVTTATAYPAKLLRTPKIYNALITSKEKILPSEAYPATTGPIFQPIGLPGQPVFLPPSLIINRMKPVPVAGEGTETEMRLAGKPPLPVTFFPRYSVYYAHQPYLTLQQPILYNAYEVPSSQPVTTAHQKIIPRELALEERKDLSLQKTKSNPKHPSTPSFLTMEYVKNNRPANINIPDIPPPPPPVRFREEEESP